MSYKVYYTGAEGAKKKPSNLLALPSVRFSSRKLAMAWALRAKEKGATIYRIEGPWGFVMTQQDLERKYSER